MVSVSLLLSTLAWWLAVAGGAQVPLVNPAEPASVRSSWTDAPSPDSTAADIFSSLSGLLQFWPNTIFRTGHTVVPATIPAGTILHHGSFFPNATVPTSFEWLAFDFEHAYIFCAFECHVFKFVANRDLKLLYLDGASAANWIEAMQTIDVILYGEVPEPSRDWEEWQRAEALCDWGVPLGLDGFIRMEFHFEVIFCNFTNGLTLLEPLAGIPKQPPPGIPQNDWPGTNTSSGLPDKWIGTQPDAVTVFIQGMMAGEWHARSPGETRVRPHLDRAVTFYDPSLESLRERRRGMPRTRHRLAGISREDARAKVQEIEEVLEAWRGEASSGSGADWASAMRQVEERYSSRLLDLNYTLHSASSYTNASAQAAAIRRDVLIMISPFVTTADVGSYSPNTTSWLDAPMERCSTFATSGIRAVLFNRLTPQERIALDAIEGTQAGICRVIGLIWLDAFGVEKTGEGRAKELMPRWKALVDELLGWLDWTSFKSCRPGCAADEICYITTWPFTLDGDDPSDLEFTPRCVSIHSRRRTSQPPSGWPPTPPNGTDMIAEGLTEALKESRAHRRRRIDL